MLNDVGKKLDGTHKIAEWSISKEGKDESQEKNYRQSDYHRHPESVEYGFGSRADWRRMHDKAREEVNRQVGRDSIKKSRCNQDGHFNSDAHLARDKKNEGRRGYDEHGDELGTKDKFHKALAGLSAITLLLRHEDGIKDKEKQGKCEGGKKINFSQKIVHRLNTPFLISSVFSLILLEK